MDQACHEEDISVRHLEQVEGIKGQYNDIYVHYGASMKQHVLFFPGDAQDFREHMQQHRDNRRWVEYCYENCAKMLADKFPDSCVWIVKPSRMNFKTFACYENFFPTYNFGVPSYQQEIVHAWLHLSRLFNNMIKKEFADNESITRTLPVRLVSFSKGCVVLNQLLLELPVLLQQQSSASHHHETSLEKFKAITWLDNGLPGNSGAWVVNEESIQAASSTFELLELHTTPYQMEDIIRPWVAKEKKKFVELLRKYKANVVDASYFHGESRTLDVHFKLLKEFRTKPIIADI